MIYLLRLINLRKERGIKMFIEWWMLIALVVITGLYHMIVLRKEFVKGYVKGANANLQMLTKWKVISINTTKENLIIIPSMKGIKINAEQEISTFNYTGSNRNTGSN